LESWWIYHSGSSRAEQRRLKAPLQEGTEGMEPLMGDFCGAWWSLYFQVAGEQVSSGRESSSRPSQQLARLERQGQGMIRLQGFLLSGEGKEGRSSNRPRGGGCSEVAPRSAPGGRATSEKIAAFDPLSGEEPLHTGSATINSAPKPRLTCRNPWWGIGTTNIPRLLPTRLTPRVIQCDSALLP